MHDTVIIYIFIAALMFFLAGTILPLIFSGNTALSKAFSYYPAIISSVLCTAASVGKLIFFSGSTLQYTLNSNISFLDISFRIDNLTAFFILLVAFLSTIVSIYSFGYTSHYEHKRNTGLLGSLYCLFTASMLLVVASGHMFFFLISWELMSLTSYFLVIYENEKPEVQKAGLIYLVMTHIGTAFITAGFILIYRYTGSACIGMSNAVGIPAGARNLIFILLLVGFGTKAGIIPLHIWLPHAHPAAPSNISAIMSGVMIKTAIYGMIRFILYLMYPGYQWWGIAILVVGAVSTVLGVAYALMEHNIKRLLAYHSIENIGIILMGLGLCIIASSSGNMALAALALTAALFHTFNHSIFKGLLFLGAGAVHFSTETKDIEKLGGLIRKMPYTALFFLIGSLSISAIPPFNGFISEWLTYQSMFFNLGTDSSLLKLVILASAAMLALAGALAAYCFVKVFGISFLGLPRTVHSESAKEVGGSMLAGMGILSGVCMVLGLLPMLFIRLLDSVNHEIFNVSIAGNLKGIMCTFTSPLNIGKDSISPLNLLLVMLFIFILAFCFIKWRSAGSEIKKYSTWDCGYGKLDSRMQYTATGFSKPVRIVFRGIFKPQRELKVEGGTPPYFISSAKYNVSTQSFFEKYIYDPIVKWVVGFARKARYTIQTGSIHTYLLYIFIVIILMLLYYSFNISL